MTMLLSEFLARYPDVDREAGLELVLGYVRQELPDVAVIEGVPAGPTPAGR